MNKSFWETVEYLASTKIDSLKDEDTLYQLAGVGNCNLSIYEKMAILYHDIMHCDCSPLKFVHDNPNKYSFDPLKDEDIYRMVCIMHEDYLRGN